MNRFKQIITLVATIATMMLIPPPGLFAQSRSIFGEVAYDLVSHLWEWGEEFDCYFTIEDGIYSINSAKEPNSSAKEPKIQETKLFEAIQGISDIDSLVGQLRRLLPYAEVRRDPSNTAVIHIIQKQLLKMKGYLLDVQKDIQFNGFAREFMDSLGEVSPGWKFAFQNMSYGSSSTIEDTFRLQIDAKGKTVRTLMSDWLSLPRLGRVLWIVKIWNTKKGLECNFSYNFPISLNQSYMNYPFYGLVSLDSDSEPSERVRFDEQLEYKFNPVVSPFALYDKMSPGKSFKFSDGQVAWAFNDDEPKGRQKAMDYIEKHAGEGVSSQVRWSMLYLSKHKVLKAIPLLLKHIDELYSPVPVRETAYPAVEALTALGVPAAKAAEISLKKETDSKRIELLCWTILNVYGRQEGLKHLNAVLEDSGTDDLVKRFKLAVAIESLNNELLLFERLATETKKERNN